MNLDIQRKIDRILGSGICRLLSLFYYISRDVTPDIKPKRILVILLSEMGSLVLARPMFDYLKERYPHASLFVLLFERNVEFLEVLDLVPSENIFTVNGNSFSGLFRDSIHVLREIRRSRIDSVIDCELFSRISSIYSFLSGAGIRAGFHPHTQEGLFRGDFINRPVLYNPYHHISYQFITLAKAIESDLVPTVKDQIVDGTFQIPRIKLKQGEVMEWEGRFRSDFPHISAKKLVLLYPGGGLLPIRAWPLKNFCLVAEDFIQKGYTVCIIGTEEDKRLAKEILTHCRSKYCVDLTGYTRTVRELIVLFHFASLLITNDGGPGHFASMTPIPCIIFYGPETPVLYRPLDEKVVNLYKSISCSPCLTAYNHRNSPCDGDNLCLKKISFKEVLIKAYEILEKKEESQFSDVIRDH
ncbi:MAG: glycosyltransferase family 9 protein [Deltaproteobacteria bacterium]|nr:glycosyltransferase family 9 protein [Deltaproteobacteria bacterium]